jgi:hypothetical protein
MGHLQLRSVPICRQRLLGDSLPLSSLFSCLIASLLSLLLSSAKSDDEYQASSLPSTSLEI